MPHFGHNQDDMTDGFAILVWLALLSWPLAAGLGFWQGERKAESRIQPLSAQEIREAEIATIEMRLRHLREDVIVAGTTAEMLEDELARLKAQANADKTAEPVDPDDFLSAWGLLK